ncbi:PIG-L family deacetylase [Propionibacterium sp.]|uniref:PIG-L family deacetylase n=1 Tax=Propionibacterium sp. TaxID=1977903 RepID=UPI0039EC7AFE
MATWVFLHAHPDDESSQTAGTMAMAHDRGDRVVNIIATDGTMGTAAADLREGETVADRRREELMNSARVLGIDRVEWLGYQDSGMTGWPSNADPRAFCNADPDQAAARVAEILREEQADVLVGYDPHGGYGHPDHIMVHTVGTAAAALVGGGLRVLQGSFNQDARADIQAIARRLDVPEMVLFDPEAVGDDGILIGSPASELRWAIDLPEAILERKRNALAAHASQTSDAGFFLTLPAELFQALLGCECYREPANPGPLTHAWPLDHALPADRPGRPNSGQ